MGTPNQSNPISVFTVLFVGNQAVLLWIALSGSNLTAGVFFWLGIAFMLSRMEPVELRYCALLFWLGLTFAIVAYWIAPRITFTDVIESPKMVAWAGAILYFVAAAFVVGATYRAYVLPKETSERAKRETSERQS